SVGTRAESGIVVLACQPPTQQSEGCRELWVGYPGGSRDELSRIRAVYFLDIRIAKAGQLLRDPGIVTATDDRTTAVRRHRGQRDARVGGCRGRPDQSA